MQYFISDTHYHHSNIVEGISTWKKGEGTLTARPFKTLDEHDNWLVGLINHSVGYDDELYHMGDWSFGGKEQIELFRNRLICKNIHLICGNHDQHISGKEEFKHLFTSITDHPGIKLIEINKQKILMSHYAARTWYADNKGSWMLYGHSHGNLKDGYPEENRLTLDVGVDMQVQMGRKTIWSFTELKEFFAKRTLQIYDHHDTSTHEG